MQDYRIQRKHIEDLILTCYLDQNLSNELDQIEFEDYKIPYELFKSTRTAKLIAKAIYNLQTENKPIDDLNVICYIKEHTTLNEMEFLEITSHYPVTFDTMKKYIKQLEELNEREEKEKILREII